MQAFTRTGAGVFRGVMEDKIANAAAFKGARRLQVLEFEEYVAVK
jgi:hypothetical protein